MSGGFVCVHMVCLEPRFLTVLVAVASALAPRDSEFLFSQYRELTPSACLSSSDSEIPFAALTSMRPTNCYLWGYQLKQRLC